MLTTFPPLPRTILSLLSSHTPHLATEHKAHYLELEFRQSTNRVAVGRDLVMMYKESGEEWNVERARVMVAMATMDRYAACYYECLCSLPLNLFLPPSISPSLPPSLPPSSISASSLLFPSCMLDEAFRLLEAVTSTLNTLTPSQRHQAHKQLAIAHTLRAFHTMQGRIG